MVKSSIFHVTNVPFHVWSSYLYPGWPHTTKPKQTQRKKLSNLRGLLHNTDSHSLNNNNGGEKRDADMWISIILWLFTKGTDLSHLCITQCGKIFFGEMSFIFFLKPLSKSSHTKWSKYHISSSEPGSSKSIVWALWQPTRCRKGMHDCISFISGSYHDITAKDETMRTILLLVILADYRSVRKIWSETKLNYDLFWGRGGLGNFIKAVLMLLH